VGGRERAPVARWLVRFGYDGLGFHGWASQPGLRTVEGELVGALRRRGFRTEAGEGYLAVASRTDRGVSARANALALASALDGRALLRVLNGLVPDVFFSAAEPVSPEFSPRRAMLRRYRYFEPAGGRDEAVWRRLLAHFVGPVDPRSFGRAVPPGAPARREVSEARVRREGPWLVVDLAAPSFVWGMVRKIVAAVRATASGTLPEAHLVDAIAGRRRLTLPLAEPDRLVLWEVVYPFEFRFERPGLSPRQRQLWASERQRAAVHEVIVDHLSR
jgi:tRNA pseudouridine38-40 synthase